MARTAHVKSVAEKSLGSGWTAAVYAPLHSVCSAATATIAVGIVDIMTAILIFQVLE